MKTSHRQQHWWRSAPQLLDLSGSVLMLVRRFCTAYELTAYLYLQIGLQLRSISQKQRNSEAWHSSVGQTTHNTSLRRYEPSLATTEISNIFRSTCVELSERLPTLSGWSLTASSLSSMDYTRSVWRSASGEMSEKRELPWGWHYRRL